MNSASKLINISLSLFLLGTPAWSTAAGARPVNYTNFGLDLVGPIFPEKGSLAIYRTKGDAKPMTTFEGKTLSLEGDREKCLRKPADGWVFCDVDGVAGWVKRASFKSGGEIAAPTEWPFRYWLYVASSGMGGEETDATLKAMRTVPYLVAPSEYDNIFFHVQFDSKANALSPRTGKPTGDKAFIVDDAVYLAPENEKTRDHARWLFLGYYNASYVAICPSRDPISCMSAANLAAAWPGVRALNATPAPQYAHKDRSDRWFGEGRVAFARHRDPAVPLMYRVPDDVHMRADPNGATDAVRARNREKLFCIADCQ